MKRIGFVVGQVSFDGHPVGWLGIFFDMQAFDNW